MIVPILILTVVLPLLWLVSEFHERRWLRISLGCGALFMSFAVAWVAGSLERFNSNAWFGTATKDLIENTIDQLDAGNNERVVQELKNLRSKYEPTYENRAQYDTLVAEYVKRVSDNPTRHDPGDPDWKGR